MASQPAGNEINAEPTKRFFVEMFTKDIPLDQAVLDLVDNSVDGARRAPGPDSAAPLEPYYIRISLSRTEFRIEDNCGGFDKETARQHAFRFGRDDAAARPAGSIGQFGVGMKRALFKFGKRFRVLSATSSETWAIDVPVADWLQAPGWHFDWSNFSPEGDISNSTPGTEIVVTPLQFSVGVAFGSKQFENTIIALIKSKHRSFIAQGLSISVNGTRVQPLDLTLYSGSQVKPGIWSEVYDPEDKFPVRVKLIAGVGASSPAGAGWYIICNGRIILEADTRDVTGWGQVFGDTRNPKFHGQFSRFRGIATFDSDSSARIPWNTTKTDIDGDNAIWRDVREHMMELMRPVIDFLNVLDSDIEKHTRDRSPMNKALVETPLVKVETLPQKAEFLVPAIEDLEEVIRYTKIQYSREVDEVEALKKALNASSAKAVGEKTFDMAYNRIAS